MSHVMPLLLKTLSISGLAHIHVYLGNISMLMAPATPPATLDSNQRPYTANPSVIIPAQEQTFVITTTIVLVLPALILYK